MMRGLACAGAGALSVSCCFGCRSGPGSGATFSSIATKKPPVSCAHTHIPQQCPAALVLVLCKTRLGSLPGWWTPSVAGLARGALHMAFAHTIILVATHCQVVACVRASICSRLVSLRRLFLIALARQNREVCLCFFGIDPPQIDPRRLHVYCGWKQLRREKCAFAVVWPNSGVLHIAEWKIVPRHPSQTRMTIPSRLHRGFGCRNLRIPKTDAQPP